VTESDWRSLLESGLRRGAEEAFLCDLIESVRVAVDAEGVGLYVVSGTLARRRAARGDGMPGELDHDPSEPAWLEVGGPLALRVDPVEAATRVPEPALVAIAAAAHAAQLAGQLKRQRFEVAQRGVQLEALYDVGLAIASTFDPAELGDEILLRAISLLDARRGALYLADRAGFLLRHTLGGDAVDSLSDCDVDGLADAETARSQDVVEVLPGSQFVLAVPIETDGVRRGLLVVGDKESRSGVGPFAESDARTLSLFANQAGIALQNADLYQQALEKERLEGELELAADIQRRLLPANMPEVEGYEVVGWNRSARHVGGDYYDFIEGEYGLTLLLADVSGKGMPAALLVSTLHSAFRLLTSGVEVTPELIARLNAHIFHSSAPNKFITLVAASLRPEEGVVQYISAGHNPAVRVTEAGEVDFLESSGLPIGMLPASAYQSAEVTLAHGDLLCIYSDGMTECENRASEELGETRLAELLAASRGKPLEEVVRDLDQAVTEFAGDVPQADDQTLVLLRRA